MQAIVLVLRGCPAGWLGAYGNEWVATPHLDSFAAESVVFDQHFADCPESEAASRAWRTGRYQVPAADAKLAPPPHASVDLIEALNRAGVRTVLLRANHPDTDVRGFDETWSEVIDARPQAEDASPLDELVRRFPQVLEQLGAGTSWLLWIEIDRLLPPWDVPQDVFEAYLDEDDEDEPASNESDEEEDEESDEEDHEDDEADEEHEEEEDEEHEELPAEPVTPWSDPPVGPFDREDLDAWEWLHSSFAAVVTTLDAEVGRLLDQMKATGLDPVIAITSDFGWPMGEHGQIGPHRPWLHEEFVHVPLLLRMPGAEGALRRVSTLTQPCDLMPTLLQLFGISPPSTVQGQSFLGTIRGDARELRPYALSGLRMGEVAEWSLRTSEWAFLLPSEDQERRPGLYAKPEDRWEMSDQTALQRDWFEHVAEVLRRAIENVNRGAPTEWPELKRPE